MKATSMNLTDAMSGADFVQIDGVVFAAEYLRIPDETTLADDVVMELTSDDQALEFTLAEIDGAQYVGEGIYRLRSGERLRFLTSATIH